MILCQFRSWIETRWVLNTTDYREDLLKKRYLKGINLFIAKKKKKIDVSVIGKKFGQLSNTNEIGI